ncbi:MAG: M15 family metallopeptidase [Sphingomonas sp.]|nr:M15 family metallopeptidase [Sphingomonas sp.]
MLRPIASTLALVAIAPLFLAHAAANAEELCPGRTVSATPDGRMLGHIPYAQVREVDLVPAPAGFAIGAGCKVRREVAGDLVRMLAAANAVRAVKGRLRAVSCFRTVGHQRAVFCGGIGGRQRDRDVADRARSVGPPGYSEHATGYAIDFGTRPSPGCADVSVCFASTPAGQWLIAHAPEFGFELSFPPGNAQSVTYEPWHWRWVGSAATVPGAAMARGVFTRARQDFPAQPTTIDTAIRLLIPPPVPATPQMGPPPANR